MSASDNFCSPPEVTIPLEQFFGGPVDCDPCSNVLSIVRARRVLTVGGLHTPWNATGDPEDLGATAFWNPPYSKTAPWKQKAQYEMDEVQRIREMVALVMSVPSTGWWRGMAMDLRCNPRIIITKRLCFIDPAAAKVARQLVKGKLKKPRRTNARFDTSLFFWGTSRKRAAQFDREFASIASWSSWGRSVAA